MEEDFFLKNMKGVKPFKKDNSIVKTKTTIKKNVSIIENKLNCIFKETFVIIDNFDDTCISISGFKKLNESQIIK